METLYRFEDAEGKGPWTTDEPALSAYLAHQRVDKWHQPSDMPRPLGDGPELTALARGDTKHRGQGINGLLFSFRTKAQLKRAFPSGAGRRAMAKYGGIKIVVYEVPEAVHGDSQSVFDPTIATRKGELDPVTLKTLH